MAKKSNESENLQPRRNGRPTQEETVENWYHVASLHVMKGYSQSKAFMTVYGTANANYATRLFHNPRFLAIVNRLRLSMALDDESVRKNIEALYLQTITSPDEQIKNKLTAAAQWQKLRGLESQKVEIRSEVDDFILEQLKKCELAMKEQAEIRAAKGRTLRPELIEASVEIEGDS